MTGDEKDDFLSRLKSWHGVFKAFLVNDESLWLDKGNHFSSFREGLSSLKPMYFHHRVSKHLFFSLIS